MPGVSLPVVQLGTPAYNQIVHHFGEEVLLKNGELDREKLGTLIFSSPEKRTLLNSITHPPIRRAMLRQTLWYFVLGEPNVPDLFTTHGSFLGFSTHPF